MEFSFDLVPGMAPVSVFPYRMAPLELLELKNQLEELMSKLLLNQVFHLGESPMLLVKRRIVECVGALTIAS